MNYDIFQANHAQQQEQLVRSLPFFDHVKAGTADSANADGRFPSFLTFQDQRLLFTCPTSGDGVHNWTFSVLRMLSKYYQSDERMFMAAKEIFTKFANREVSDGEILRQIPNVFRPASSESNKQMRSGCPGESRVKKWPLADLKTIESIVAQGFTFSALCNSSPVTLSMPSASASAIIEALFPGDPLLCCGRANNNVMTQPLSCWMNFEHLQFIVPSPMSEKSGLNKSGKRSHRCLDNTGPRRFLVVEFDFKADVEACESSIVAGHALSGSAEERVNAAFEKARLVKRCLDGGLTVQDICAALIDHLSNYVKPALVVHSGGKSLHAWFYCNGVDEADLRRFMEYAVRLGADPATWTRCQLVRMPGGTRYSDAQAIGPQAVCYFDPEVLTYE